MNAPNCHIAGFSKIKTIILIAALGLLAAIAIPYFNKARAAAQKNACIANLKQVESAIGSWTLENKKSFGAKITAANLTDYLKGGVMPTCPVYPHPAVQITTVEAPPTCPTPGHVYLDIVYGLNGPIYPPEQAARNQCLGIQRLVAKAIQQWALENKKSAGSPVTSNDIARYLWRPMDHTSLTCPANLNVTIQMTTVDAQPTCSTPGHQLSN